MKLWQKNTDSSKEVELFTVGRDKEFDLLLAPFDVLGSLAHVKMLQQVNLITKEDFDLLQTGLKDIYKQIKNGTFNIDDGVEDVHSQVEFLLTDKFGDTGKKIHTARSRNDQVLVDLKLFFRSSIENVVENINVLFKLLLEQSEKNKDHLLPGYTHLQLAMPSSFGLWFGAYAESLADDMITLQAAWEIVNKNPLGSAAGFGSSFPINRSLTTKLLGFSQLNSNVVYAQMTRGKTEKIVAQALGNVAATLAKMSADACLFLNQHFQFISFPDELTTGSSIMPHKKNPDVFELIRAHCNRLQALPNEIAMLCTNLTSGYHRDLQLLKEMILPAFITINNCLHMATLMITNITVKENILEEEKYKYLFTVEEMNKLVLAGMPLRDAYKKIGTDIENNTYEWNTHLAHTHEGSIGNLQNENIRSMMDETISKFHFEKVHAAIDTLLH